MKGHNIIPSHLFYKARHWLLLAIVMQHLDVLVSINAKDFAFQKFMASERFPVFSVWTQ